jgi:hypothetical protein
VRRILVILILLGAAFLAVALGVNDVPGLWSMGVLAVYSVMAINSLVLFMILEETLEDNVVIGKYQAREILTELEVPNERGHEDRNIRLRQMLRALLDQPS